MHKFIMCYNAFNKRIISIYLNSLISFITSFSLSSHSLSHSLISFLIVGTFFFHPYVFVSILTPFLNLLPSLPLLLIHSFIFFLFCILLLFILSPSLPFLFPFLLPYSLTHSFIYFLLSSFHNCSLFVHPNFFSKFFLYSRLPPSIPFFFLYFPLDFCHPFSFFLLSSLHCSSFTFTVPSLTHFIP